jgi:very-short-patch-repair endonuclease
VSDVPIEKPDSNVPLTQRDDYWLTPIEVPFYEALRETGLIFAVQPWIQGVERRYRLDFLIFYDGGMVAVELDGHEAHKSKEQRMRDAKRDRWFAERKVTTVRWTGSEVRRDPQECVRQLLSILRGTQARA